MNTFEFLVRMAGLIVLTPGILLARAVEKYGMELAERLMKNHDTVLWTEN